MPCSLTQADKSLLLRDEIFWANGLQRNQLVMTETLFVRIVTQIEASRSHLRHFDKTDQSEHFDYQRCLVEYKVDHAHWLTYSNLLLNTTSNHWGILKDESDDMSPQTSGSSRGVESSGYVICSLRYRDQELDRSRRSKARLG